MKVSIMTALTRNIQALHFSNSSRLTKGCIKGFNDLDYTIVSVVVAYRISFVRTAWVTQASAIQHTIFNRGCEVEDGGTYQLFDFPLFALVAEVYIHAC